METTAKTHIQRLSLTRCNLAAYCNNVSHFGNIASAGMGQKDLNKRSFCLLILPEMANMLCTSKLSLLLKKKIRRPNCRSRSDFVTFLLSYSLLFGNIGQWLRSAFLSHQQLSSVPTESVMLPYCDLSENENHHKRVAPRWLPLLLHLIRRSHLKLSFLPFSSIF